MDTLLELWLDSHWGTLVGTAVHKLEGIGPVGTQEEGKMLLPLEGILRLEGTSHPEVGMLYLVVPVVEGMLLYPDKVGPVVGGIVYHLEVRGMVVEVHLECLATQTFPLSSVPDRQPCCSLIYLKRHTYFRQS